MRILVTGATGYLGSELVRRAPEALTRRFDVRDEAEVERAFSELRPEAVIHTAYRQHGPDAWATNVGGSRNVARAAAGARLVHVSTDVVFSGGRDGAYAPQDEPDPVTDYGRSKAEAERAVASEHPDALIVRTSLLYGGEQPSKHELLALAAAAGEADVTFFTDEIRCPTLVGELADALLELAAGKAHGPIHLAGGDAVSRYDFAVLVARAAGRPADELRGGESAAAGVVRPRNCALRSSRSLTGVREVLAC